MRSSLLSFALLLCACSKREAHEPAPATAGNSPAVLAPEPGAPATPHAAAHEPPGAHAGPQTPQVSGASSALTTPPRAGGITWEAPPQFERRAPKSAMRAAEYGLAGAPQAELGVFYFGADQGGSVEANITRWVGQFKQSDGKPTEPKRSTRTVKGIDVALVEANGSYAGMAMPGAPAPTELPSATLLGAIAKGPEGSVFFKLVGPRAEIDSARPAFDALIDSLHKADGAPAGP